MSADKRAVHTDALQTLGTIITEGGRDAIHLAVEPVVAGEGLNRGEDIVLIAGKAYASVHHLDVKPLGIVDPFLKNRVRKGEMFWLIVYPRQITSLRHVWEHPDFPSEVTKEEIARQVSARLNGDEAWIKSFANDLGMTYAELMGAADRWRAGGDYTYDNSEVYKEHFDKFDEFWDRYEQITGQTVADKSSFFTCSC